MERGASDFETWSRRMQSEEGDDVNPYLERIFQWSVLSYALKTGSKDMKQNCWEFYGCTISKRRTLLGRRKTCPAYRETRLHGIHGGKNGGRACWIAAAPFCRLHMEKTRGRAWMTCQACDFYRMVQNEEGVHHIIPQEILEALIL